MGVGATRGVTSGQVDRFSDPAGLGLTVGLDSIHGLEGGRSSTGTARGGHARPCTVGKHQKSTPNYPNQSKTPKTNLTLAKMASEHDGKEEIPRASRFPVKLETATDGRRKGTVLLLWARGIRWGLRLVERTPIGAGNGEKRMEA
ncbi:hypothetical protein V6N12_049449 [Hibiscus sabdariffa]|uniref:Uncharacterized protein n=1 Tax=Hibiscus sabdariffa TaxID=183260 RepID=A0ABR2CBB4_9ROSI